MREECGPQFLKRTLRPILGTSARDGSSAELVRLGGWLQFDYQITFNPIWIWRDGVVMLSINPAPGTRFPCWSNTLVIDWAAKFARFWQWKASKSGGISTPRFLCILEGSYFLSHPHPFRFFTHCFVSKLRVDALSPVQIDAEVVRGVLWKKETKAKEREDAPSPS